MRIAYVVDVHGHFDAVGRTIANTGPVDVLGLTPAAAPPLSSARTARV